jgi:hypothetical protein
MFYLVAGKLHKSDRFPGNERVFGLQILAALKASDASPPLSASENASSASYEVEDEDDQRDHQQKVNETAGDVETEAQCPQNQNYDKDCPEHTFSFASRASANIQIESWTILHANSQ